MSRTATFLGAAILTTLGGALLAAEGPSSDAAAPRETKAERDARMAWWRDARFGMFIHWGIYAVPAGEWKGLEKQKDLFGEWIMYNARIPVKEYEPLARQFNPVKFDADAWVKAAKGAGMKYIVITAKHCDGFAMYGSKASKYNIVDATPYARDPIVALREACDRQGIKLGFYYSHCWDWHEPDAWGLDNRWDFPDRAKKDSWKYFREKAFPQVKELLERYRPSVLWFDVPSDIPKGQSEQLRATIRRLQPDCIVNDRIGHGLGDYGTPEQYIPPKSAEGDFEVCMTLNNHWGFDKNDHAWKPAREVICNLVDIASKGGNYLLNVGPTAQGEFPPEAVRILAEVGAWMKANGPSLYGTTAAPLAAPPWGRCTAAPGKLYLHVFDWPSDGRLIVPGLKTTPRRAYLLADDQNAIKITRAGASDLVLGVPARAPDAIDSVVVLEIDGAVEVDPMPTVIDQPGIENVLSASQATIHGRTMKYHGLDLGVPVYDYLGEWTSADDTAAWQFRTIAPGAFDVEIVYSADATSEGNSFTVAVDDHRTAMKVKATGGATTFKRFKVGTATLAEPGTHALKVTADSIAQGSSLMNLHKIVLVPVGR
jgi:alpha-L-fucosidase